MISEAFSSGAVPGDRQLAGPNQLAVLAGYPDGLAAVAVDGGHNFLVDAAAEHHLDHVHGLGIGHAHAVDEFGVDIEFCQQGADLGSATVHHHRVHSHQLHQHHVPGEALVERGIDHGVAAELDHDGLAGEALDIGQRLGQYLGDIERCFAIE